MSTLLAIHSYPGANDTLARHWPYFLKAEADGIIGIGTRGGGCVFPCPSVTIGNNEYMNGPNLCYRLIDTLVFMLSTKYSHFCIAEYDTVFFSQIPKFKGVAAHRAGGKTFESPSSFFIHNPWMIDRESASKIVACGMGMLDRGACAYGTAESSPDVFLAWVCESLEIPVKFNAMKEHSQNSYDIAGSLEAARDAYRAGLDCIHGIKHAHELEFITT